MGYLPRERERESSAMKGYGEKARRKSIRTHNAPSLLSAFLSRFTLFSTIFRNFQTVDANDG